MLHLEIVWPIYYRNNYESDIYKTDKTHIYNTESFRRPFWYFCDGPARYFGQKLVTTFTFYNCVMENDLCHSLFVYHLKRMRLHRKLVKYMFQNLSMWGSFVQCNRKDTSREWWYPCVHTFTRSQEEEFKHMCYLYYFSYIIYILYVLHISYILKISYIFCS